MAPGDHLGPYEILAPLGAGGMGTVYKARDTRLDRVVAIKVSQAQFSERFAREARAIAQLNHPNICQLYDVGPNYLVMEYVEGKPISAPDSPRKLLDLAVQVADGMAAAHTAGIVHRDLKPDNILVTAEARVKILDFGLAKAIQQEKAEDETQTIALTDPGTTIGTVAYMSPEQARGEQNLGAQSDQFAFGLVLYEMVAGKRAFVRASRAETMTAIIREDADPLPATAPAPLKWVIGRLMAKDAVDRYDSSRDLYRELKNVRERLSEVTTVSQAEPVAVAPPPPKRSALPWVMLAAGLAAGGAAAFLFAPKAPTGPDVGKYKFTPISRDEATERTPAWSPDGKSIAYTAPVNGVTQVFTRLLDSSAAQTTHGDQNATAPFWSPDGGTIYFQLNGGLWAVASVGGTPERIFERAGSAKVHPDGKMFFFTRDRTPYFSTREGPARRLDLDPDRQSTGTGDAPTIIGFSPDGRSWAGGQNEIVQVRSYPSLDPRQFSIPNRLDSGSWMPDSRRIVIAARSNQVFTLSMLDTADGSIRAIYSSPDFLGNPSVSPDGKRIAYVSGRFEWNLMEADVANGRSRPILASGGTSWYPSWARSGKSVLFATSRSGQWAMEELSTTEGFSRRVAEVDLDGLQQLEDVRWAPDGVRFTFRVLASPISSLMLGNVSGSQPVPLAAQGDDAIWSPEGDWVVYRRTSEQRPRKGEVLRIRPGSTAKPELLASYDLEGAAAAVKTRRPVDWSAAGILTAGPQTLYIASPDFKYERELVRRHFANDAAAFTKDGKSVLGLYHNTTGKGDEWQLYSIDVATGAEKLVTGVDLPVTTDSIQGFSLHPDGTRFATSIAKWPYDIWMLEGFE